MRIVAQTTPGLHSCHTQYLCDILAKAEIFGGRLPHLGLEAHPPSGAPLGILLPTPGRLTSMAGAGCLRIVMLEDFLGVEVGTASITSWSVREAG